MVENKFVVRAEIRTSGDPYVVKEIFFETREKAEEWCSIAEPLMKQFVSAKDLRNFQFAIHEL